MDTYKIVLFGTFDASQLDFEIIAIYNNSLEEKNCLGKESIRLLK